ncbi:hypothetical protein OHA72_52260 [Dactylosporangium sp. NBC_01737]|uniref:hypothetical protein n=1 Tax=Dactylosporangium sp. NBC_01737 TaxID=2975959 RepID=UPI002E0EEBF7|nr:hypothetical protein OHA72_52260 [Dactylosporangium sp. NBC_01737]
MIQVRLFTAAVLVAAGLLGVPAAAHATDPLYPPTAVTGGVNKPVVTAGGSVSFGGSGFKPGETITVTIERFNLTENATGAAYTEGTGTVRTAGLANVAGVPEVAAVAVQAGGITHETVIADGLGAFLLAVRAREVGRYVLTATGSITGNLLTAEVVIRARSASSSDSLAVTGPGAGHWAGLLATGFIAILLGAVLVRQSRRRRTAE